MQVEVKKVKMTDDVIMSILEIDKEFYTNFDYSDSSWYFERYSDKNDAFLLVVDGNIVGYFLIVEISKSLYDDILRLKHDHDYDFPPQEWNCKSGCFYIPSVLVKQEYRRFSLPLLERLYKEVQTKNNLVAITVSQEGHRMAEKVLKLVGVANPQKDVRVYGSNLDTSI